MTYIELINAFWDKRAVYPLTSYEADFYFYLLKECDSRKWINPFKLPTQIIERDLNLNRRTICEIRNKLQQNGYISVVPSTRRGEVTEYEIVDITIDPFMNANRTQTERKPNANRTQNERKEAKESISISKINSNEFTLFNTPAQEETLAKPKRKKSDKDPEMVRLNSEARKVFTDIYRQYFDAQYVWSGADAGQMTRLLSSIRISRESRSMPLPTDTDSMIQALNDFLLSINKEWIMKNFSVKKIASQYNEIISEIKLRRKTNGTGKFDPRSGTPAPDPQNAATYYDEADD